MMRFKLLSTRVQSFCVVSLVLVLVACSASTGAGTARRNVASYRPYSTAPTPSIITVDELLKVNANDLYQAVQRLRPEFLNRRNPAVRQSAGFTADVYVDDRYYGGINSLASFRPWEVREVRLVSQVESAVRYGSAHYGGTIMVRTR